LPKTITQSQKIGEIGEKAAALQFLRMGFQFDGRSRLEAGIDGIAEIMDNDHPTAKMIAVQVKATQDAKYTGENGSEFSYRVRSEDLEYWRGSNLPVILVLYRHSDDTFYWKSLENLSGESERTLRFNKEKDTLDSSARDRIAALTVAKQGHGYYVPPLGGGEDAIVNMFPILLPEEIYVSQTRFSTRDAIAQMKKVKSGQRFDWMIHETSLWSFCDPLKSRVRDLVERDQVEKIETDFLARHEAIDQQYRFASLLRQALAQDFREVLGWDKEKKQFYFLPMPNEISRRFHYQGSKQRTFADVVSRYKKSKDGGAIDYVRHHSFVPHFERLGAQWYLVVNPSYYFTFDGFRRLTYPDALLSGKKRLDNNNSVRGQVVMWQRLLSWANVNELGGLLGHAAKDIHILRVGDPLILELPRSVPEDVWGGKSQKPKQPVDGDQQGSLDI
jgi:hypothetical protein